MRGIFYVKQSIAGEACDYAPLGRSIDAMGAGDTASEREMCPWAISILFW
jgi:hypothetical protein